MKPTKGTPKAILELLTSEGQFQSGHSWRRTLAKALSYRAASFAISTYALSAFFGLPVAVTFTFNLALMGVNFVLMIGNEVGWRRTSWGKGKK